MLILDRPNPINGRDVEGNLLNPEFASFVGPLPIPMRHGMTIGELMLLYNEEYELGCKLHVITAANWDPNAYFEQTRLPWVLPSPNMPLIETAVVYPGQVILEGTNISEGRGTTRPFEIFGAPFVDPASLIGNLDPACFRGAVLRETYFSPTFNKWANHTCRGFQIHVVNRDEFKPYRATLALLSTMIRLYPEEFQWSAPPYEYVADKLPVDVILGDSAVREQLEEGRSVTEMEREWTESLEKFLRLRSKFLLYSR